MKESRETRIKNLAIAEFKKINPGVSPILLTNETLKPILFFTLAKADKVKMSLIENELLHQTAELSSQYVGGEGKGIPYNEMEGMFKIGTKRTTIVCCSYSTIIAGRNIYRNFTLLDPKMLAHFNALVRSRTDQVKKESITPPPGFTELTSNKEGGLSYRSFDPKHTNTILHDSKEVIRNTMRTHFKYAKNHGEILKILVYGEFGTGKTECVVEIAKELLADKPNLNITYAASELQIISMHMIRCAKTRTPTIVIIEEAEHWLKDDSAKFFLGSHNEPKNKAGAMYVFITNNPEHINKGVIARDERVDEIIPFTKEGMSIEDKTTLFLASIAKHSAKVRPKIEWNITDYDILKPLSGAEVIGLVKRTIRYCRLKALRVVTNELLNSIRTAAVDKLRKAEKYSATKQHIFQATPGFK